MALRSGWGRTPYLSFVIIFHRADLLNFLKHWCEFLIKSFSPLLPWLYEIRLILELHLLKRVFDLRDWKINKNWRMSVNIHWNEANPKRRGIKAVLYLFWRTCKVIKVMPKSHKFLEYKNVWILLLIFYFTMAI